MSFRGRMTTAVLLVAATFAFAGCTSQVSGTVVSSTTGAAIVGATVWVGEASTITTVGGDFTLRGVPSGTAGGVVSVEGYSNTDFSLAPGSREASVVVRITDSTLAIKLFENAVEPKAIQVVQATLDGRDVAATQTVGPIAPGPHRLAIRAAGHEDFETTITLSPGANEATAALSLTAMETYSRFYAAGRFHRDPVAYKYIHPDERKRLSLKKWKAWGSGTQDKSIKFGEVRMLAKWTSKYVKKTYRDVAEVDRTIVYQVTDPKYSDFGKTYTDNFNQHWVKLSGRWYIVHAKGP